MTEANQSDLLNQLELILESDPLIDEVGFIHPSQFDALWEEAGPSADKISGAQDSTSNPADPVFWIRNHKLGISISALLTLYEAAKHAFMGALRQYKMQKDSALFLSITESEVLKHSKALLLLSCDFGTAWNSRKLVVSKKQQFQLFMDELSLSTLVLSYAPKSERAWGHRRWGIRMIAGMDSNLEEIVEKESELVEKIAEKSKMNYRAWNHRSWLVSYMSGQQALKELHMSRGWAGLHVADNSCFHYRARLMLKILNYDSHKQHDDECTGSELHELWKSGILIVKSAEKFLRAREATFCRAIGKEELDWVETLIRRYVGREALWLHRRFLSFCWIKLFENNTSSCSKNTANIEIFMDKELSLCTSCSIIPDNQFEDYQAQATFSATYAMWLIMQLPAPLGIEYQKKLESNGLKKVLNYFSPEKSFLWDTLTTKFLPRSSV